MRDHDEEDRKKTQPVSSLKKGDNASEAAEASRWRLTHEEDDDRDRHHHVT